MADQNRDIAVAEYHQANGKDVEKSAEKEEPPIGDSTQRPPPQAQEHVQFSTFTTGQKRAIVAMGSLAAFFSPLSSSIYFPALDTIASALGVSVSKINLTVTTYLVSLSLPLKSLP